MRTSVPLESIGALIEGKHENPFSILGPHEVNHNGRRALAVRAYLPHSDRAWVVNSQHAVPRPMRRIHPAGFFEAICPIANEESDVSYQLSVADRSGHVWQPRVLARRARGRDDGRVPLRLRRDRAGDAGEFRCVPAKLDRGSARRRAAGRNRCSTSSESV